MPSIGEDELDNNESKNKPVVEEGVAEAGGVRSDEVRLGEVAAADENEAATADAAAAADEGEGEGEGDDMPGGSRKKKGGKKSKCSWGGKRGKKSAKKSSKRGGKKSAKKSRGKRSTKKA
jgi:hypothetical protein